MKSSRVVAAAVLAGALIVAPAAAWAEDAPVAEPPVVAPPAPEPPAPPAVTPPPAPVAPPPIPRTEVPVPPSEPPAPYTTTMPQGVFYPETGPAPHTPLWWEGLSQEELHARLAASGQAQLSAFAAQYGNAIMNYSKKGGGGVSYDHTTGVFTDIATGAVIDIAAYGVDAGAIPEAVAALPASASLTELEAIIAEPVHSVHGMGVADAPAPLVEAQAGTGDATGVLVAGWIGVAALAFWRKRYRAFELLRALGRTA